MEVYHGTAARFPIKELTYGPDESAQMGTLRWARLLGQDRGELSESPDVPADDTNIGSGGLPVTFDSSAGAFPAPWNTSAGVR